MRELPILFSAPMIRAILDGRKTVTRRVVKPQPSADHQWQGWCLSGMRASDAGKACWGVPTTPNIYRDPLDIMPPYEAGDRLWVRETHAIFSTHGQHREDGLRWGPWGGLPTTVSPDGTQIAYFREGFDRCDPGRWRPSIHMPRWASRITLEVTGVRVERLQDITYEQALAEGAMNAAPTVDHFQPSGDEKGEETARRLRWPQRDFALLWDGLAKPGSCWADNPWVWAVEFRQVEGAKS